MTKHFKYQILHYDYIGQGWIIDNVTNSLLQAIKIVRELEKRYDSVSLQFYRDRNKKYLKEHPIEIEIKLK